MTISGTPGEVVKKLVAAKAVTTYRKQAGWTLFNADEEWDYIPIHDERLCPVCASFEGRWNGLALPIEFMDWRRPLHPYQILANNEVYPNVHTTYPYLRGNCRCVLEWVDYLYTLTNRLMDELEVNTR